jgi:hypothetical protein
MTNDLTTSSCAIAAYLDSGHYDPSIQFKQGRYHTGKIEVPIGSSFLALVLEHKIGWQSWADRMPGRSVMGYLHQGYEPPARETLGDLDPSGWERDTVGKPRDPWQRSEQLPLMTSDDKKFIFVTSSLGGHSALVDLQRAYFADGRTRNPIVELGTEMFSNSYGSRNHKPVFKIIDWNTPEQSSTPAVTAKPAAPKRPAASIIDDDIDDFAIKR